MVLAPFTRAAPRTFVAGKTGRAGAVVIAASKKDLKIASWSLKSLWTTLTRKNVSTMLAMSFLDGESGSYTCDH